MAADKKRNVLIERVTVRGAKAHRIRRGQEIAAAGFVHRAALVAEAEHALTLEAVGVVDRARAELSGEIVRKAAAVTIEDAAVGLGRDAEVSQFHGETHAVEREADFVFRLVYGWRRKLKALRRELIAPRKRHVLPVGADAPRRQQGHVAAHDGNAQDVVEKIQPRGDAVRFADAAGGRRLCQPEMVIVLHASGSFLRRKLRAILP